MPENWKIYKLGDISDITMGQSPKGETTNNIGKGLPLLNGPTEFGYSFPTPTQFTIDPKRVSKIGDLLFCVRGSTTGKMNFSDQSYAIGRGIGSFRGKNGFSTKYVKYIIDFYLDRMLALCTGSTFPNLNRTDLENFDIISCSPKESEAIASILSALDDKIELNLQMNKTLEEMAMALYKHWFVDFGPFQDGEFVDSELGEIPKGWEVQKLEDLLDIKYGKDHKKLSEGNIPVYGSGGIMRYVDKFLYDKDSILIPRKGTLSNLFYLSSPFWSVDTMFYSKIKKQNFGKYIFYFLKSLDLASMDVGSAVPSLTTELLKRIRILVPPTDKVEKFDEIVSGYFRVLESNNIENQTLTTLRDTLLPKLISGEVRVKDAEKTLSEIL
jgi:type I restriction enzyme S subunit